METVTGFIFLGSKVTADGDCSYEIKRHLLLGRKVMTNLDGIKKQDITLPSKFHLVKCIVFPGVMYGCESWTIKKAEPRRIDSFELWCWRRLFRIPWPARRSSQSILKEMSPEYLLDGPMLKLKLPYFGHLMQQTDSLEKTLMGEIEGRRRRGWERMRWLYGITNSMDMFSSVQFSHSVMSDSLRPHEPQHTRPPYPSPTPEVHPNPCLLSQWCHPAISSSIIPFSSCPQSCPASGSFQVSQLFASGGQSIGVSALASVFPMNTQGWSALEWTGWISLQSTGLSRVFSNTTVQKHQFFGAQLSL